MGYLCNMKVTISESQFIRMVNNSKGWGLIGINEGGKPKNTLEYIKDHSNELELKYLGTQDEKLSYGMTDYNWLDRNNKELRDKIMLHQKNKKKKKERDIIEKKYLGTIDGNPIPGYNVVDTLKQGSEDYYWLKYNDIPLRDKIKSTEYSLLGKVPTSTRYVSSDIKNHSNELELKYLGTQDEKLVPNYKVVDKLTYNTTDYSWLSNYNIPLRDKIMLYQKNKDIEIRSNDFLQNYKKNKEFNYLMTDYKWLWYNNPNLFKKIRLDFIKNHPEKRKESIGEKNLKDVLNSMGFTGLIPQYKYDDCRGSKSCRQYMFDIYLPYTGKNIEINGNIPKNGVLFEFDGEGHFKSIKSWGGDDGLSERIYNDVSKNEYTKTKEIKLIRIPYTSNNKEIIKSQIIDALNNPNQLVLTGNYPKLGWNA